MIAINFLAFCSHSKAIWASYVIVNSSMTKKQIVDLCYSNPVPDLEETAGETHRAVKEELVLKGIFPDSNSIPTGLISYVIKSWGQVYDAGYADGCAARNS